MQKYWVKNYFAHGRFPEVSQKQKRRKKKKRRERLNDGDNNGQATHGARKHAWRTQATWAKKNLREVDFLSTFLSFQYDQFPNHHRLLLTSKRIQPRSVTSSIYPDYSLTILHDY